MRYPEFTGHEPCATIGTDFYYAEGRGSQCPTEYDVLRAACLDRCHMLEACTEWSLRHERHGFWAGMTENERAVVRRKLNIILADPVVTLSPVWSVPYAY